jgi:phosphonate transport system substrate-binding protein
MMMARRTMLGTAMAVAAVVVGLQTPDAQAGDPIRLAITDIEGMEQLQREFGAFRELLSKTTGLEFEFYPVASRTAAVEAMASGKLEFALAGPAEYVVFRARTEAEPVIAFSRPDYYTDVIVLADSPIDSVTELKGTKVAMGDVGSTSKHLAPMQILADNGLDPRADIEVVHTSVKLGWEALKRGDVAAFATTDDKFQSLRADETEFVPGAFRVIARSRDLPNDVLLVRPDVDKAVVDAVRAAIMDHQAEFAAAILTGEDNQKYKGMTFIGAVSDADYDYVRSMFQSAGFPEFAQFPGEG